MAFDNFFKRLMQDFLKGCEIHPDDPVGKLPLKIDLVVKCLKKPPSPLSIPALETHFSQINLFEYKSSHDIPKEQDLSKLVGYLGLYCDQHDIGIEKISSLFSVLYISVKRPTFLEVFQKEKIFIKAETNGVYKMVLPFLCPYFLMVINELDITEENIPLLLLSSGETLKNTIKMMVRNKNILVPKMEKYLSLLILYEL